MLIFLVSKLRVAVKLQKRERERERYIQPVLLAKSEPRNEVGTPYSLYPYQCRVPLWRHIVMRIQSRFFVSVILLSMADCLGDQVHTS